MPTWQMSAELSEFVLEKFKKTWYRFTLKDKQATTHLGKYLRTAKLREFMDALGAPLGVVVWDAVGNAKFKQVREEVRKSAQPGLGIGYRKLQYILCIAAMHEDPACSMPLDEQEDRDAEMLELRQQRSAMVLQAIYRGKKGRLNLGVTKGATKSESEQKAASFKKKFVDLMANPSRVAPPKALPAPGPPRPPPAPAGKDLGEDLGPGVQPNVPPAANPVDAEATAEVRNVFRERAAQRAAAAESKANPK